jgi:glycosyltransferase involved in cell wall biosynthesis
MSSFRRPILIASRLGSISTPIDELFERFNTYGREVRAATHGEIGGLLVFGSIPRVVTTMQYDCLEYRFIGKNPLTQLIRILQLIRTLPDRRYCFIAGDVWLAGVQVQLLKFLAFKGAKTQVSIHGVPNFASSRIIRHIKVFVFNLLLKHVDSIRVVSQSLIPYLSATTHVKRSRIFVSPIPMSFPEETGSVVKSIDVALVGRLHVERGVSEAKDILQRLLNSDPSRSILIIGDGPLSEDLSEWRHSLPEPNSVTLLGHIPNSMVSRKLLATRVLLSCAIEEGYGLALREALSCGAFVVARRNSGTQELLELHPEAVFLFDTQEQALETLLGILTGNFSIFDNQKVIQKQRLLDKESLSRLALSWIN